MKKRIFLFFILCLLAQWSVTQAPKWMEGTKRAVFSMVAYGENDKILNVGNGFFVTEDGIALSDYSLLKGAQRTVVVNSADVQMPVVFILGTGDIYDITKFRVDISAKKVPALNLAAVSPAVDANVYILPYSTQKSRFYTIGWVEVVDKLSEKCYYYTLNLNLKDKVMNYSVITEGREVSTLTQKSSSVDIAMIRYTVDTNFAMAQSVSAFSFGDMTLKNIGVKKALSDMEEETSVFLFMVSSQVSQDKYVQLLGDFIAEYPSSADDYIGCATNQLHRSKDGVSMERVEANMDKTLNVAQKKDDMYYNHAELIYSCMLNSPEKPYKD